MLPYVSPCTSFWPSLAVIGTQGVAKPLCCNTSPDLAQVLRGNHSDLAAGRLGLAGSCPCDLCAAQPHADHRRRFADHADPRQRQLATFINHYLWSGRQD